MAFRKEPRGSSVMPSLSEDANKTPTAVKARSMFASADSPFVRFMEFQPLPSPAAVAKAKAASSPAPFDQENAPMQNDVFHSLLARAMNGGKPPAAGPRGVAIKKSALSLMSMQELSLATATASMKVTASLEQNEHAVDAHAAGAAVRDGAAMHPAPQPFAPPAHVPDKVERAQADLAQRKKRDLERARRIAQTIKKAPSNAPSNVFLGKGADADANDAFSQLPTDWEALPTGTKISVWWEGNQEAFECIIRDWHVAVGPGGKLFYTHRCEYAGGTFDHDLSKCEFEV